MLIITCPCFTGALNCISVGTSYRNKHRIRCNFPPCHACILLELATSNTASAMAQIVGRSDIHVANSSFGRFLHLSVSAGRKGDGKKQRKPKTAEKAEELKPASSASNPSPPRVDPRLGSARRQIAWSKLKKVALKTTPSAAQTKSFRLPTKTPEQHRAERERQEAEALQLSKTESKSFALSKLHNSQRDMVKRTVLLVDGYNVIGEREGKNDKEGSDDVERIGGGALLEEGQVLEDEREKLIASLSTYSFREGVRIVAVFDALGGNTAGVTEELRSDGVTVVFCGNEEADTFLARAVKLYLDKGYNLIVLVTNDQLIRLNNELQHRQHKKWGQQEVYCISVRRLKYAIAAMNRKIQRENEMVASKQLFTRGGLGPVPEGLNQYYDLLKKQRQERHEQLHEKQPWWPSVKGKK